MNTRSLTRRLSMAEKSKQNNAALPIKITKSEITLGDELGVGGFSSVYKGSYAGQEVAIKAVLKIPEKDSAFESHEIEMMQELQQLNVPHIMRLLAYINDAMPYFLIMPLMKHGTLYSHIGDDTPFRESTRYRIVIALATALQYMHDHLIIHSDVKPENVLLDKHNNAYLADFDAATHLDPKTQRCEFGSHFSYRGTINYMAPEIINRKYYSTGSDVFAFTILLWETLAWKLAYDALLELPNFQTMRAIDKGFREKIPDHWPRTISNLITSGWHHENIERPTMQHVRAELVQHATSSLKIKM